MVGRALGLGRRGDLPQFAVLTGVRPVHCSPRTRRAETSVRGGDGRLPVVVRFTTHLAHIVFESEKYDKWLSRRSWKSYVTWEQLLRLVVSYPLSAPRIVHRYA